MDDAENISRKTWSRNIQSVNKIGYMDGAADGQAAVFQSSFDLGYKQGFSFGMELGFKNAMISLQDQRNSSNYENDLRDSRKINCQLCNDGIPSEQNIFNLFNTQHESNTALLKKTQTIEND